MDGFDGASVQFYTTSFKLDLLAGSDVPLSFEFANTTTNGAASNYRAQLYVHGYQFGKYGKLNLRHDFHVQLFSGTNRNATIIQQPAASYRSPLTLLSLRQQHWPTNVLSGTGRYPRLPRNQSFGPICVGT